MSFQKAQGDRKAGRVESGEPFFSALGETLSLRNKKRRFKDYFSRWVISAGGILIIAAILGLFVVILAEVLPLFMPPRLGPAQPVNLAHPSPLLGLGLSENGDFGFAIRSGGAVSFSLPEGKDFGPVKDPLLAGASVASISPIVGNEWAMSMSDGRLLRARAEFPVAFKQGVRQASLSLSLEELAAAGSLPPASLRFLAHAHLDQMTCTAAFLGAKSLRLFQASSGREADQDLMLIAADSKQIFTHRVEIPSEGEVTCGAFLAAVGSPILALGTSMGRLLFFRLPSGSRGDLELLEEIRLGAGSPVTACQSVLGHATLIVGDAAGQLSSWQWVHERTGKGRAIQVHAFQPHKGSVTHIIPAGRHKGFLTSDTSGMAALHYATTGKTQLEFPLELEAPSKLAWSPKGTALMAFDAQGQGRLWGLDHPHPEVSLGALFGATWFEGYAGPGYFWQTTGGNQFEQKFCLVPLLIGTLKGTFYALMFAIPLGLLSALYTSQFMHPRMRGWVKPAIEIMAAMPSVVLGFLAGLWLAPVVQDVAPGIFVAILCGPMVILASVFLWSFAPSSLRECFREREIFLLIPVVLAGLALSYPLGEWLNQGLCAGDYRSWLFDVFGIRFDQRNSLVVGLAMGVAVIPIIFTITEDSLANVPQHLKAGALALGSTPWQAAVRVVLPTASAGIFSAIMIGFGRAVGETMIVLMATGNTPILNWSMFSGFRAFSANIAVELPDTPEGSTHFRILFLTALILFLMTFVTNTIAEVVRLRLRRKYSLL